MKLFTFVSVVTCGASVAFACSSSSDSGSAVDASADAPSFTCDGVQDPAGKTCGVGDQCQVDIPSTECIGGQQPGDTSASCFCATGTWQCSYVQSKVTTPCGDGGSTTSTTTSPDSGAD